jgi:hypothetical protein
MKSSLKQFGSSSPAHVDGCEMSRPLIIGLVIGMNPLLRLCEVVIGCYPRDFVIRLIAMMTGARSKFKTRSTVRS